MSQSINKVILIGNVTRDPELRTTKSGKLVCDFGIATNRAYTDDKGQRHEQAQFHNIVAWGKLAEIAGKYLVKEAGYTLKADCKPATTKPTTVRRSPAQKSSLIISCCWTARLRAQKTLQRPPTDLPVSPPTIRMTFQA
jgi:hypothetical protein